jgi:hypothetical protein
MLKPKPPKPTLDRLLKNIAEDEPKPKPKRRANLEEMLTKLANVPEDEAVQQSAEPFRRLNSGLAQTIADAIRRKVEKNWSVPIGTIDAGKLVIRIRIRLKRDGSVLSAEIVDQDRLAEANFRTMAESARRAVKTASPFEFLKPHGDKYSQWRDITMTFRPPV